MDFSVLLADLRDVAEKYKGQTTDPQVASHAYADMFIQILKRTQNMTDNYEDQITMLLVALNQLSSIYKDLSNGSAKDQLTNYVFGMCARTVLNIQWAQLDDEGKVKKDFVSTVQTVHENLKSLGYKKFQLILNLMESQWADPVLTQIMASDDDDIEDGEEYIKNEDPEILKLRIEIMMKENCEEFALNLCEWSLKHPNLKDDSKIREYQVVILYRQGENKKLQEVCSKIMCHDGIYLMSRLAKNVANQDLCIRLAQIFLIQDWINPERNCCTQELLKLWIHHQYLADKDEERFIDSIWTVAKVCRTTEQIGVLIDGVRRECGDMFIQLYTELCKYALNIDKGNMEQEEAKGNNEEVEKRKKLIVKTCVRMAYMLKEYDFRMSRICGLTAFSLIPTTDNLNLVNKLYWTIKHTSVTSGNSNINPATIYEVERLLGLMRPERLNPDYSWKQLIPLCKRYQIAKGFFLVDGSIKPDPDVKRTHTKPNILSTVPKIKPSLSEPPPGNHQQHPKQQTHTSETFQSLQYSYNKQFVPQSKNLSHGDVAQMVSEKLTTPDQSELKDGPPLTMKELDKTINDLKKSIVLENRYSKDLAKRFPTIGMNQGPKGNLAVKTDNQSINSVRHNFPTGLSTHPGNNSSIAPFSRNITRQNHSNKSGDKGSPHSQDRNIMAAGASITHQKGNYSVLRPPGSANQECAKIAQQIAEMHEKQRKEKEMLDRKHHGRIDGSKLSLNSGNVPSRNKISELLSLTMKSKNENVQKLTLAVSDNTHPKPNEDPYRLFNSVEANSCTEMKEEYEVGSSVSKMVQDVKVPSNMAVNKNLKKQKYYLATEEGMNSLKRDSSGNINLGDSKVSIKPVFSMVVPKSLMNPDNQQQLMKTVKNMVKQANIAPAFGTKHAVVDNKVVVGEELKGGIPEALSSLPTSTHHSGLVLQSPSVVITTTAQITVPSSTATVTRHVSQFATQGIHHKSLRPILPNPARQTQLDQSTCQTGDFVMTVVSDAGVQNLNTVSCSSLSVLSPANVTQQLNLQQTEANCMPHYQQYIQSSVPQSQFNQHFIQQQTFTTPLQYGEQHYSQAVYVNPVVSGQPVLATKNQVIQPQSVMPVVPNFGTLQHIPLQSFSLPQSVSQTGTQVQVTSSASPVTPELNFSAVSQNQQINGNIDPSFQNSIQNQPLHLDIGNTGILPEINNPVVERTSAKPFIAPPELSPAVLQQILSSLKQASSNRVGTSNQAQGQTIGLSKSVEKDICDQNLAREMIHHLALNKTNENVKKSVIEATQKILELRKQYDQGKDSTVSPEIAHKTSSMPEVKTDNRSMAIPELPDLGSKEFEIDTILCLEENVQSQKRVDDMEHRMSKNVDTNIIEVRSDKEMLKQLETFLEPDFSSSEAKLEKKADVMEKILLNQDNIKRQPQSTYLNANRIAKEREKAQGFDIVKRRQPERVTCKYCNHFFKDENQLQQHLDRKLCQKYNLSPKEPDTKISCTICKKKFVCFNELKDHIRRSCSEPSKETYDIPLRDFEYSVMYKCTNCNWMNGNEKISKKHVENCSSNVTSSPSKSPAKLNVLYKCRMCAEVFCDKEATYKHVSKLCPQLKARTSQKEARKSIDKLNSANKFLFSTLMGKQFEKVVCTCKDHYNTNEARICKNSDDQRCRLQGSTCSNKEMESKPVSSSESEISGIKSILNGEVHHMKNAEESNDRILSNSTEAKISNIEEKYKKKIANMKKGTTEEKKDDKMDAELMNMQEIKRLKENLYFEQFTELELKRKALQQQKNMSAKPENIISTACTNSSDSVISNRSDSSLKALSSMNGENSEIGDSVQKNVTDIPDRKRKIDRTRLKSFDERNIAYNVKRRRKAIDVRKEKGLRAKRLIKQKRYLIDEMEPILPEARKTAEKKADDSENKRKQVKMLLKQDETGSESECKVCKFRQRNELLAKHYVERHGVGFKQDDRTLKCKFCVFKTSKTSITNMKQHIVITHWERLLRHIRQNKVKLPTPLKVNERSKRFYPSQLEVGDGTTPSSNSSPRKSEKMSKHLKALAMRKKCAENLQKIAKRKLSISIEVTDGHDGDESDRDENANISEKPSETVICPRDVRNRSQKIKNTQIEIKPKEQNCKHPDGYSKHRKHDINSTDGQTLVNEQVLSRSVRKIRSRSSSQSSRSSINEIPLPVAGRTSASVPFLKDIQTRSRKMKKHETDSSNVTESSNLEDDDSRVTDDEEQSQENHQKRKINRRNSRCSDRRKSADHFSSESSDEGSVSRHARSIDLHSGGIKRSLRDRSRKGETTKTDMRSDKNDRKGKSSQQASVSEDEYLSSATDITDSYFSQKSVPSHNLMVLGPKRNNDTETELDGSKETSEVDSESDIDEIERSYSFRQRKNLAVYKDYESSDMENSDIEKNTNRMNSKKLKGISLGRDSEDSLQSTSFHDSKMLHSKAKLKTISVLVGPDDEEFIGLKDSPKRVPDYKIDEMSEKNWNEETECNSENIACKGDKQKVSVMKSEEEFLFLQSPEPSAELNNGDHTGTGNPKMAGFNKEFTDFAKQQKVMEYNDSSESEADDILEDDESQASMHDETDNKSTILDVPVLPPKTDFESAFHKFSLTKTDVIKDHVSSVPSKLKGGGTNFLSAYENFFESGFIGALGHKSCPKQKTPTISQLKQKYGIKDCFVRICRLQDDCIPSERNKAEESSKGKTVRRKPCSINSDRSSESDGENNYANRNTESDREKNNDNSRKTTKLSYPKKEVLKETLRNGKDRKGKVDEVSLNETLIQDIVVPGCLVSEMLQEANTIWKQTSDYQSDQSKLPEHLNENQVKTHAIDVPNEEDQDEVWVENAESVAENHSDVCEPKSQEIVILTEPIQEEMDHQNVLELHITENAETNVENVITIVEDYIDSDGNGQSSVVNSSNIVLIEVQEDDQVIITHEVQNYDKSSEQCTVASFKDDIEEKRSDVIGEIRKKNDINSENITLTEKEKGNETSSMLRDETTGESQASDKNEPVNQSFLPANSERIISIASVCENKDPSSSKEKDKLGGNHMTYSSDIVETFGPSSCKDNHQLETQLLGLETAVIDFCSEERYLEKPNPASLHNMPEQLVSKIQDCNSDLKSKHEYGTQLDIGLKQKFSDSDKDVADKNSETCVTNVIQEDLKKGYVCPESLNSAVLESVTNKTVEKNESNNKSDTSDSVVGFQDEYDEISKNKTITECADGKNEVTICTINRTCNNSSDLLALPECTPHNQRSVESIEPAEDISVNTTNEYGTTGSENTSEMKGSYNLETVVNESFKVIKNIPDGEKGFKDPKADNDFDNVATDLVCPARATDLEREKAENNTCVIEQSGTKARSEIQGTDFLVNDLSNKEDSDGAEKKCEEMDKQCHTSGLKDGQISCEYTTLNDSSKLIDSCCDKSKVSNELQVDTTLEKQVMNDQQSHDVISQFLAKKQHSDVIDASENQVTIKIHDDQIIAELSENINYQPNNKEKEIEHQDCGDKIDTDIMVEKELPELEKIEYQTNDKEIEIEKQDCDYARNTCKLIEEELKDPKFVQNSITNSTKNMSINVEDGQENKQFLEVEENNGVQPDLESSLSTELTCIANDTSEYLKQRLYQGINQADSGFDRNHSASFCDDNRLSFGEKQSAGEGNKTSRNDTNPSTLEVFCEAYIVDSNSAKTVAETAFNEKTNISTEELVKFVRGDDHVSDSSCSSDYGLVHNTNMNISSTKKGLLELSYKGNDEQKNDKLQDNLHQPVCHESANQNKWRQIKETEIPWHEKKVGYICHSLEHLETKDCYDPVCGIESIISQTKGEERKSTQKAEIKVVPEPNLEFAERQTEYIEKAQMQDCDIADGKIADNGSKLHSCSRLVTTSEKIEDTKCTSSLREYPIEETELSAFLIKNDKMEAKVVSEKNPPSRVSCSSQKIVGVEQNVNENDNILSTSINSEHNKSTFGNESRGEEKPCSYTKEMKMAGENTEKTYVETQFMDSTKVLVKESPDVTQGTEDSEIYHSDMYNSNAENTPKKLIRLEEPAQCDIDIGKVNIQNQTESFPEEQCTIMSVDPAAHESDFNENQSLNKVSTNGKIERESDVNENQSLKKDSENVVIEGKGIRLMTGNPELTKEIFMIHNEQELCSFVINKTSTHQVSEFVEKSSKVTTLGENKQACEMKESSDIFVLPDTFSYDCEKKKKDSLSKSCFNCIQISATDSENARSNLERDYDVSHTLYSENGTQHYESFEKSLKTLEHIPESQDILNGPLTVQTLAADTCSQKMEDWQPDKIAASLDGLAMDGNLKHKENKAYGYQDGLTVNGGLYHEENNTVDNTAEAKSDLTLSVAAVKVSNGVLNDRDHTGSYEDSDARHGCPVNKVWSNATDFSEERSTEIKCQKCLTNCKITDSSEVNQLIISETDSVDPESPCVVLSTHPEKNTKTHAEHLKSYEKDNYVSLITNSDDSKQQHECFEKPVQILEAISPSQKESNVFCSLMEAPTRISNCYEKMDDLQTSKLVVPQDGSDIEVSFHHNVKETADTAAESKRSSKPEINLSVTAVEVNCYVSNEKDQTYSLNARSCNPLNAFSSTALDFTEERSTEMKCGTDSEITDLSEVREACITEQDPMNLKSSNVVSSNSLEETTEVDEEDRWSDISLISMCLSEDMEDRESGRKRKDISCQKSSGDNQKPENERSETPTHENETVVTATNTERKSAKVSDYLNDKAAEETLLREKGDDSGDDLFIDAENEEPLKKCASLHISLSQVDETCKVEVESNVNETENQVGDDIDHKPVDESIVRQSGPKHEFSSQNLGGRSATEKKTIKRTQKRLLKKDGVVTKKSVRGQYLKNNQSKNSDSKGYCRNRQTCINSKKSQRSVILTLKSKHFKTLKKTRSETTWKTGKNIRKAGERNSSLSKSDLTSEKKQMDTDNSLDRKQKEQEKGISESSEKKEGKGVDVKVDKDVEHKLPECLSSDDKTCSQVASDDNPLYSKPIISKEECNVDMVRVKSDKTVVNAKAAENKDKIEEMEDDEEIFKRRMESVKRARKKSAIQPYESDFNFDNNSDGLQEDSKRNTLDTGSYTPNEMKMITRGIKSTFYQVQSDQSTTSQSQKPRCYKDFTEEIKTQMKSRSKEAQNFKSVCIPSPVKSVVTRERTKTYTQDSKVQIFSPHIFTCDSVKKITRQRALLEKNAGKASISVFSPSVSQDTKTVKPNGKGLLKESAQANSVSRSQRNAVTKKGICQLTTIKSPQKVIDQCADSIINSNMAVVKQSNVQRSLVTETGNNHEESSLEKKKVNPSIETRSKAKSSAACKQEIKLDKEHVSTVQKPDKQEKTNRNRQSIKNKKQLIEDSSLNSGKRRKKSNQDEDKSNNQAICKAMKPDGTSKSPEKLDMDQTNDLCKHGQIEAHCECCSANRRSRTTSPKPLYDNSRKTVRQIIHGGKVFEITKGSVTEREIQVSNTKLKSEKSEKEEIPLSNDVARVSTRGSMLVKTPQSKQIESSDLFGRKRKNLNEYIHKTLEEIKKQRESVAPHKWTVKKESNTKSQKFPYAFKKSRRN